MNADSNPTEILQEWMAGDKEAPARLMPLMYQELRGRAAQFLRGERPDHTLQATALVHESFLKMMEQERGHCRDRAEFSRVAAHLMRRILIEHARRHKSQKRGAGWKKVSLDETPEPAWAESGDLLEIDELLRAFAATYPRESQVVELKFFGGLEHGEIAEALHVSVKTVSRDWNFAKAWLRRRLGEKVEYA